jgi:tRNA threonylcarbamoyladenosine biosynthesis protein TsaE
MTVRNSLTETGGKRLAPFAEVSLPDREATEALGRILARHLEPGDVVALSGPLGSGKSVLVRAIVRTLGRADEEVPSPTFTLVQIYDLPRFSLWHFDLYRIDSPSELAELGFDEAFGDGVAVIEWAERMGAMLPATALRIALDFGPVPEARRARLAGPEAWARRLAGPLADLAA